MRKTMTVNGNVITGKYQKYGAMVSRDLPLSSVLGAKNTVLKIALDIIGPVSDEARNLTLSVTKKERQNSPKQRFLAEKTW